MIMMKERIINYPKLKCWLRGEGIVIVVLVVVMAPALVFLDLPS